MNNDAKIGLVENLKNDDKGTFELIFYKFHNNLYNYVKGYVVDHEVARELVQESFIKLWEIRSKLNTDTNIQSLLYTITRNNAINYLKHITVRKNTEAILKKERYERGLIVRTSPHFRKYNEGHGFNVTYSGYAFHKYYNTYSMLQSQDWTDAPIFRMGEVLLNYAEVMKELGQFDQSVADATINKLRDRGAVAHLDINNIPDDPTRDADVDPVMWEIRRERFVEYFGEGFGRALDIKRWGKLVEYGAKEKVGRWIKKSDYKGKVPIVGGGDEGYVKIFGTPPGVPEYYYLEPIPSNEIVLNPKIKQNPGWE